MADPTETGFDAIAAYDNTTTRTVYRIRKRVRLNSNISTKIKLKKTGRLNAITYEIELFV